MSANVDDDLIEATIRRVAEAKAAAARGRDDEAAATAPDTQDPHDQHPAQHADESAIESTIRRVTEAKAGAARAGADEAARTAFARDASEPDTRSLDDQRPTRSVDESAIEATIRRVAEAKAKQHAADATDTPDDAPNADEADATVDESAIDTAIRVAETGAEQQSRPEGEPELPDTTIDESAIESTIRRVAEAKAKAQAEAPADAPEETEPVASTARIDETAIEATIRRVAEAKARAERPADTPEEASGPAGSTARVDESAIEATIQRVAEAKTRDAAPPRDPHMLRTVMRASASPVPPAEPWRETTDRLQREIATINTAVGALFERLDALTQQLARTEVPRLAQTDSLSFKEVPGSDDDEDWDESPKISSLPLSMPPRPAIFRDPSPVTATAELLVEEPESEPPPDRPPLPPLAVEPKRGFDLLPRTYRITIEDKRRSVDLVPLHRSLLAMDGVRDMSLLSYNNGVAIVALETVNDLDPQVLQASVSHAMSRSALVEVHNEYTLVVKLAEE